jgi:hypothetical protein
MIDIFDIYTYTYTYTNIYIYMYTCMNMYMYTYLHTSIKKYNYIYCFLIGKVSQYGYAGIQGTNAGSMIGFVKFDLINKLLIDVSIYV